MKFTILGSGGSIPTPRPFSQSNISKLAREDKKYQRNSSSLFLEDINLLIDTPEDIIDSINRENIKSVDYVLFTHRHPDHTFGMRNVFNSCYDPLNQSAIKRIQIICPQKVYEDIKKYYPSIDFHIHVQKTASISFIETGECLRIGDIAINVIDYSHNGANICGYSFKQNNKTLAYTPCDTLSLKEVPRKNDIWITECGIFSHEEVKSELGFPKMIENIKNGENSMTILTHLEEVELARRGYRYLDEMKKKYSEIKFEFGHDGKKIII